MDANAYRASGFSTRPQCGLPIRTSLRSLATSFDGYGYQVWIQSGSRRIFVLKGIHGQFVDPASKLIMVHTAVRQNRAIQRTQKLVPYGMRSSSNSAIKAIRFFPSQSQVLGHEDQGGRHHQLSPCSRGTRSAQRPRIEYSLGTSMPSHRRTQTNAGSAQLMHKYECGSSGLIASKRAR
jgi:hypothetical protein